MKIIEVISSLGPGGAETLVKDLALYFRKNNHEVMVVLIDKFTGDIAEKRNLNSLREGGIEVCSLGRSIGEKSLTLFRRISQRLKHFDPDVVHVHSFAAALYFLPFTWYRKNVNYFYTIHSTKRLAFKFNYQTISKVISKRYNIIYCSGDAARCLEKELGEGIIIENGISPVLITDKKKGQLQKIKIPEDSIVGINVGSIRAAKNQIILLDIFDQLNIKIYRGRLFLLICGQDFSDDLWREINTRKEKLKFPENIKFLGPRGDIHDLLNESDFYISSSIYEGLPIAVLEAMSVGLPLYLSPIPEHKRVFENINHVFFPKINSIASFTEIMSSVNFGDYNKEILRQARREQLDKFHINTTGKLHIDFFSSL